MAEPPAAKTAAQLDKEVRLAAALRENLRRRKAQSRARAEETPKPTPTAPEPPEPG